jgi:uncharacterized protein YheU (UPF0270 family)
MIIPIEQLPVQTLENIIEAYVLSEGTDYGFEEASFADKVAEVKQQLRDGRALLVYSELYETVNIVPKEQFKG